MFISSLKFVPVKAEAACDLFLHALGLVGKTRFEKACVRSAIQQVVNSLVMHVCALTWISANISLKCVA